MVQSKAKSPKDYIQQLPEDRRPTMKKLRALIRKNLPKGYVETMRWGMLCYEVPLKVFPDTYNGEPLMYAALASQKVTMVFICENFTANHWATHDGIFKLNVVA